MSLSYLCQSYSREVETQIKPDEEQWFSTLILQSCRVSNEPFWFLVAPLLNFIAVENSIMPIGISTRLWIDFSVQHKWFPMREHLRLWNCMCSRKYCLKKRCELETGNFCPKIYQLFSEPQSRELFMFVTTF